MYRFFDSLEIVLKTIFIKYKPKCGKTKCCIVCASIFILFAKLSLNSTQLNSTQLNSTSTSNEAEIALFPVSDKPPTRPPTT